MRWKNLIKLAQITEGFISSIFEYFDDRKLDRLLREYNEELQSCAKWRIENIRVYNNIPETKN